MLGYGYVQFENEEQAASAIKDLNNQEFKGSTLDIQNFVNQKNRTLSAKTNIYIKNFPADWTKEDIQKFIDDKFSSYGEIVSKNIFEYNKQEKKYFYACIAYKEAEMAKKAIEDNNNKHLTEEHKSQEPLYVVYALPKQFRNAF